MKRAGLTASVCISILEVSEKIDHAMRLAECRKANGFYLLLTEQSTGRSHFCAPNALIEKSRLRVSHLSSNGRLALPLVRSIA